MPPSVSVAEDVVSFGTAMDIVSGRKALRKGQWESIWENITDFKMDLGNVEARGSGDQAWGSGHLDVHGLRQRSQAVRSPRSSDRYTRTARRSLARSAYALLPVSRHPTAHLRHGGVASGQIAIEARTMRGRPGACSLLCLTPHSPFPIPEKHLAISLKKVQYS